MEQSPILGVCSCRYIWRFASGFLTYLRLARGSRGVEAVAVAAWAFCVVGIDDLVECWEFSGDFDCGENIAGRVCGCCVSFPFCAAIFIG
jgi:hypothetical protein